MCMWYSQRVDRVGVGQVDSCLRLWLSALSGRSCD